MVLGILFDSTLCIGCFSCSVACKETHNLSGEANPADLDAETFTVVKEKDGVFCRNFCRHCLNPACVSACPVGALKKKPEGPVVYDGNKCIGCRYCILACPYSIPRYEWSKRSPRVRKCDFCYKRLGEGKEPACAEVCPTGATRFGNRAELLKEARVRINSSSRYFRHIFGEFEVGGSSVLMIADRDISEFGLKIPRTNTALPELTRVVLNKVPAVAIGSGLILSGLWWLTWRKKQVAMRESCERDKEDR